ncbi:caspase family protein [Roseateles agri]|nr:caspase family protein [Paucibacter sp. R3-3]
MTTMKNAPNNPSRRRALAGAGALGLQAVLQRIAFAQGGRPRTDVVTVLYRREQDSAPPRLDPVVQSATLALEDEFLQQGLRVVQPTAETYKVMDAGPGVIVTFASDAGFSVVFQAYRNLRPVPGQEAGIAEVRLQARVFVGRNILVAAEGRGQMFTQLQEGQREFGERRALDLAAKKAAKEFVAQATGKLRSLTAEQLQEMLAPPQLVSGSAALPTSTILAPSPPPPVAAPAPTPAQAPAPTSTQAPAPAAPVAVAGGALPALEAPTQRWALIIGVVDYAPVRQRTGSECSDLPGVANDLQQYEQMMLDAGTPRSNILVLKNEKATTSDITLALKQLVAKVGPNDMVGVFLSGHGAGGSLEFSPSGYGMPILSDFNWKTPALLDFWQLQALCMALPCQQVLWVIDTCHSGNAVRNLVTVEVGAGKVQAQANVAGPDAVRVSQAVRDQKHFAVVTASSSKEVSYDGVFTSRFTNALRASKGKQPVEEILRAKVGPDVVQYSRQICSKRKCEEPQQTPTFGYSGQGNLIRL